MPPPFRAASALSISLQSANDSHRQRENAHENHRHANNSNSVKSSHDLGVMGVLLHVIGDAINNIGVIIAALVIWKATHDGRYYADPGVSLGIGILILASAIPLGTHLNIFLNHFSFLNFYFLRSTQIIQAGWHGTKKLIRFFFLLLSTSNSQK